jgi:hypothetical protein
MRPQTKVALILSCLAMLFFQGPARGNDGVAINITNDSTDDIMVTVYDMSSNPGRIVLTNARINGFTSVPISLVANAGGRAQLEWTATNTDPNFPRCGHASAAVSNAESVNVHADSTCAA